MGDHHEKVHEHKRIPALKSLPPSWTKVTKENWAKPSRAQEPATSLQPQYEQRIKADTSKIIETSEKRVNILVKLRIYWKVLLSTWQLFCYINMLHLLLFGKVKNMSGKGGCPAICFQLIICASFQEQSDLFSVD